MKYLIITVLVLQLAAGTAYGGSKPSSACDLALNACLELNTAYDAQVLQLKKDNALLADALASSIKEPLLPTWAWVVLGVAVGAMVGTQLK